MIRLRSALIAASLLQAGAASAAADVAPPTTTKSLGDVEIAGRSMYVDGVTAGVQVGFALEPRVVVGAHLDYNVARETLAERGCAGSVRAACIAGPTFLGVHARFHPLGQSVLDPYGEVGLSHVWRQHAIATEPTQRDLAVNALVGLDLRVGALALGPFGGFAWMPTYDPGTVGRYSPARIWNPLVGVRISVRL